MIPIIYGSLMSWKEESQIFSDQIFHQIEDPLMFQKDSETVESRLKFAPSNGFTQKCPVRPGNIFSGDFPWRSSFHQLPWGPMANSHCNPRIGQIHSYIHLRWCRPPDKDPEMATRAVGKWQSNKELGVLPDFQMLTLFNSDEKGDVNFHQLQSDLEWLKCLKMSQLGSEFNIKHVCNQSEWLQLEIHICNVLLLIIYIWL